LKNNKPWKSNSDHLQVLRSRGLSITDEPLAISCLERIGYYRLSGYWFPFRERSGVCCPVPPYEEVKKKGNTDKITLDVFKKKSTFEQAVQLYIFDKKLRLLALDALERIEISMRADISNTLGQLDPFSYLNPDHFDESFSKRINKYGVTNHHKWLSRHAELINRSKEIFVKHNKEKYGLPLPVWVASEVWDFGVLSKLYDGLKKEHQDLISKKYGVNNGRIFASWLRSLNYLRNVCAHHSRLWNRNIIDQPKLPSHDEIPWVEHFEGISNFKARPFLLFCITHQLISAIQPNTKWGLRFKV